MLLQINIKNFALIDNIEINFESGFTIFSGETGAGKSIIIDAINFSLGGKFGKDIIRTGENKSIVETVFSTNDKKLNEVLISQGIEQDELLIIRRELHLNGKSLIKINGKTVNASFLKEIRNFLIDIHGQHENQVLLNEALHIEYLDSFNKEETKSVMTPYLESYSEFKKIEEKIYKLRGGDNGNTKVIDYLKFVIDDIESANLKPGEEEELAQNIKVLSNAEKINTSLINSYNILKEGNETAQCVVDELKSALREIKSVEKHLDKLVSIGNVLEESIYNLEECSNNIRDIKESIVYDEVQLGVMNERIYTISNYKKKYGNSIEEILNFKKNCEDQYEEIINRDEILQKLEFQKEELSKKLNVLAENIRNVRIKNAKYLEVSIKAELDQLGLEKSTFKIEVNKLNEFTLNGMDEVYFTISTNPGEPLKHMNKIVSGGELGRITLALKTVFIKSYNVDTVIFDEIDVGISGRIAQTVGEKMVKLSLNHQILCITHLPQIASLSDNHILVYKEVVCGKTFIRIKELNYNEKCNEVAKMIGGKNVSNITLLQAKEMIEIGNLNKVNKEVN